MRDSDWWRKAGRPSHYRVGLRQPTPELSFLLQGEEALGEEETRTEGYSDPLGRGLQSLGVVLHWPTMIRIAAAGSNSGFEAMV